MKVVLSNNKIITDFTQEELNKIKQDLTFPNPKYHSIKKYSRYSYTSEPPFLNFYMHDPISNILVVPRGYEIPFDYTVIEDKRIEVYTKYSEFKLELRGVQKQAVESYLKTPERGTIVIPTGGGKTITALYIAGQLKQKALIVVHKNDLVDGWRKDITLAYGISENEVGIIKGKKCIIGEQFTIATIQTLVRKSDEELEEIFKNFGMIIQDEQHHCPASSYQVLLKSKAKYFLGLTATDLRNDGLRNVIYLYFGQPCFRYEEGSIEEILPFKVIIRNSKISYTPPVFYYYKSRLVTEGEAIQIMERTGVELKKAPINIHHIRKRIQEDEEFNMLVCNDIYNEFKKDKSCIVFCHEKEHIRSLYDMLIRKFNVPQDKIQLYYGDSKEDDATMKEKAERKEVLITIATFSKATEGTNVKAWERAFLVTSLANEKDVIQAIGRVRRTKEGKKDVLVYDYRHPYIKVLTNHGRVRDKVYKKLGATFHNEQPKGRRRGWGIF